ncbi:hypothetical protein ABID97_001136 [Variovorax sp. OAS795]|uniref:class I SAM-dependent methyltransferase n=1 Tax=Variovorax sp. OAS795 TaxID=3034231 RepID=UPI0033997370
MPITDPRLEQTDKSFWHGFTEFYDTHLPLKIEGKILEFGVFKGNSIRWLLAKFPEAMIHGADILPIQSEWPIDARVTYHMVDQDDETQVKSLLEHVGRGLQLVIEDGSHFPRHQSRCLRLGLDALEPGGTYVLEDIQTSHPAHSQYADEFGTALGQTSLSVLLAFEHLKRRGEALSQSTLATLGGGTHFTDVDIAKLFAQIASIDVYKRATLPSKCWKCGSSDYDYHSYRCGCGVDLIDEADSMSVVIRKA